MQSLSYIHLISIMMKQRAALVYLLEQGRLHWVTLKFQTSSRLAQDFGRDS